MRALGTLTIGIGIVVVIALSSMARAQSDAGRREASAHFQRGVELYNDGDYRGALVEFKKAYAIWPRANVLYDVGQTEFQLNDYAAALKTMERYLAETGPNAAHRAEVEATVETLRNRVGRIALLTSVPDCEVSIDEQPVGTTPIAQPILVSVGPRRLTISCPGRGTTTRQLEIAAGELVRVDPKLGPPAPASLSVRAPAPTTPTVDAPRLTTRGSVALGWTFSAVLAAATIGVGAATLVEQSRLAQMKATFPTTKEQLDAQSSLTLGLAIASDALAVASLVAIGVSTYVTVKYHRERKVRVGLSGTGVSVASTF
jgi:tetratricopeptide (TPR) repeat protein